MLSRESAPVKPFVWVLNPGAERELATSGGHETSAAFRRQMEQHRHSFAPLVAGEPAYFLHELSGLDVHHRGRTALLFCPTPTARAACKRSGLIPPPAPQIEVLRRVHRKDFLTSEAAPLVPGRRVVREIGEFDELRAAARKRLRLKRLYGYAGKGQRTVPLDLSPDDRRWVQDGLRQGGMVVEPELSIRAEFSIHGVVQEKERRIGRPCRLRVDAFGAPLAVSALSDASTKQNAGQSFQELRRRTVGTAEQVAERLLASGYFGPFALDFLLTEDEGWYLCDWNPRFSLGWSTGMGAKRDEALELLLY